MTVDITLDLQRLVRDDDARSCVAILGATDRVRQLLEANPTRPEGRRR
jgi:hypothetical protein